MTDPTRCDPYSVDTPACTQYRLHTIIMPSFSLSLCRHTVEFSTTDPTRCDPYSVDTPTCAQYRLHTIIMPSLSLCRHTVEFSMTDPTRCDPYSVDTPTCAQYGLHTVIMPNMFGAPNQIYADKLMAFIGENSLVHIRTLY